MFVVPLNAFTSDCTVHLGQQQNYRSMQCTKAALRVLLQLHFESLQQECYSQRRRLRVASGAAAPGHALEISTFRVHLKLSRLLFLIRVFMLFEK